MTANNSYDKYTGKHSCSVLQTVCAWITVTSSLLYPVVGTSGSLFFSEIVRHVVVVLVDERPFRQLVAASVLTLTLFPSRYMQFQVNLVLFPFIGLLICSCALVFMGKLGQFDSMRMYYCLLYRSGVAPLLCYSTYPGKTDVQFVPLLTGGFNVELNRQRCWCATVSWLTKETR